jgi:hypothetical protein
MPLRLPRADEVVAAAVVNTLAMFEGVDGVVLVLLKAEPPALS